ncbi:STAS domain-containing protein [Pseudonocardia sp. ICBG1293]|uniref:STAS domain-containing protein n=1 Tax=Pseudonocardia sp. ICBG1293 TaxID=2844382 RepID=UPI001CCB0684|nr:STAS domain-containing protein [Pseudonocardia sp. ICBG1293]
MTAPSPSRRLLPVPTVDTVTTDPQVRVGRGSATTVVVGVSGELDLATGPAVETRVLAAVDTAAGGRVVLDLNEVRFLGLRGVTMLRAAADRARATGTSLVVVLDPAAPAARALRLAPGHGLTVVAADAAVAVPVADAS